MAKSPDTRSPELDLSPLTAEQFIACLTAPLNILRKIQNEILVIYTDFESGLPLNNDEVDRQLSELFEDESNCYITIRELLINYIRERNDFSPNDEADDYDTLLVELINRRLINSADRRRLDLESPKPPLV